MQLPSETLPPPAVTEILLTISPPTPNPAPSVTLKVIVEVPLRAIVLGLADAERDKPAAATQTPSSQIGVAPVHKSQKPLLQA